MNNEHDMKYTKKELIDCIYYESSLELLEAIKMIVDNGISSGGNIKELSSNILPNIEDGKFILNPMNRMMLKDLYKRVYERVTLDPQDERIEFIKHQAREFHEVVIDESNIKQDYIITDYFLQNYDDKIIKDQISEQLIKSIFYICTTNILKELLVLAEEYKNHNRSLEEFANILPEITKEYVRLSKQNKNMIAKLAQEMWEWFCSINELEFINFTIEHSKDFDVATDVKPVGEYENGEVKLYE